MIPEKIGFVNWTFCDTGPVMVECELTPYSKTLSEIVGEDG